LTLEFGFSAEFVGVDLTFCVHAEWACVFEMGLFSAGIFCLFVSGLLRSSGMLASRAPVSLHRRIAPGGHRRLCIIEGKRGTAQRRHFTQALESLWRHSIDPGPTPSSSRDLVVPAAQTEGRPKWCSRQPTLENANFEEYYKVQYSSQSARGLYSQ
jgi:hypothetical protein